MEASVQRADQLSPHRNRVMPEWLRPLKVLENYVDCWFSDIKEGERPLR
jgi:hypothetical protein